MNIAEITNKYSQLSGQKIKQPDSLFSPEFKNLQETILRNGAIFGLKLNLPKDFDVREIIKKSFPTIKGFEILEQSWKQTLFFGYKVRFDVEALTVALEEYLPVALRSNGNRWQILEEKIFDLDSQDLKRIIIPKDLIFNLKERGQKLIQMRIENPVGTLENILTKIEEKVKDFHKDKIEDISKYDAQKRGEILEEINSIEKQIDEGRNELKRAKELGRIGFEKINQLQKEIKGLESKKYKLEEDKVVKLQKLDEERQEALLRVEGKCELRINAELQQIGVVEYESIRAKVSVPDGEKIVEIVPATEELLFPEAIEEVSVELEFEILPKGTKFVSPVPTRRERLKEKVDWRSLVFWALIAVFVFLVIWQPDLVLKIIGSAGILITSYLLFRYFIKRRDLRLKTIEKAQQTISEIDKMSWREFEKFVADMFEKMGYKVKRLGGWGGDYGADLIATDPKTGTRYAIQAKKWMRFRVGTSAIKEVLLAWSVYDCDAGIVVTNNYFTERAGVLPCKIKKLRVDLWDRDVLIEKIKEINK